MTKSYYVKRAADDLKLGDMFVNWAALQYAENVQYPQSRRVLNIKKPIIDNAKIVVTLEDGAEFHLFRNHLVLIEVTA